MLIRPSLLLNFFVAVVMFSIGLRLSGAELLNVLRDRALFVRTLLENCFLIPAIGFLLVHVFPLTPETKIGILLLAAIPGTPIALQFTRQAKTRLAFAAALTFVLSVVSIAMTPLAIEVIPESVQRNQRPILLLVTNIALRNQRNSLRCRPYCSDSLHLCRLPTRWPTNLPESAGDSSIPYPGYGLVSAPVSGPCNFSQPRRHRVPQ